MTAPYHFVGDGVPTSRIVGGRCPHRPAHVIPSQCSHWRGNPFPLCGGVRAPRPNVTFDGCTFNAYTNTAALYTASLTGGSNWYKEVPGMKVLDGSGNAKVITAMVWKTTTNETFELKSV